MKNLLRSLICSLVCGLVLSSASAFAADTPTEAGTWPESVEAIVPLIIAELSEKDRIALKQTKKADLIKFHHGWGTHNRNYYGLWRGNDKLLQAACGKVCYPDNDADY